MQLEDVIAHFRTIFVCRIFNARVGGNGGGGDGDDGKGWYTYRHKGEWNPDNGTAGGSPGK
jgi:hypothetical protein